MRRDQLLIIPLASLVQPDNGSASQALSQLRRGGQTPALSCMRIGERPRVDGLNYSAPHVLRRTWSIVSTATVDSACNSKIRNLDYQIQLLQTFS